MLSIEQEPIRVPEILNEVAVAEGRRVKLKASKGRTDILVPHRFGFLWDQVRIGASIYDLSIRLRARGEGQRVFLEVASFLCFLVDNDLVDDVRVVRLADSIRGEYEWPEDLTNMISKTSSVSSWGRRGSRVGEMRFSFGSRCADFLFALFSVLANFATVVLVITFHQSEGISFERDSWKYILVGAIVGLYVAGVFGRSIVGLVRAWTSRIAGDAGELFLKFDLLGPHFRFEPHTVTGAFRRATDFAVCFLTILGFLIGVALFAQFGPFPTNAIKMSIAAALSSAMWVAALFTHGATKSELTASLRVWNRTPLVWREDDELKEVETFNKIGGFFSTLFAIGSVSILLALGWWGWQLRAPMTAVFTGVTIAIIFALVYFEPFFGNGKGAKTRNQRRRLWATKVRVLAVAGADREAWAQLPVLRQLTPPIRSKLIAVARVTEYGPGEAVCRQGETDRSLFIVLEGRLGVARSFEGRRRKVVAILSSGAVFGETAFFFGANRSADVVAMENCRLLEIPYIPSMKNLDLSASEEFQFRVWLLQALSGNPMLRDLPSEAMDSLIFAGKRRAFRAGEAVFSEGAPADACYFIAQGRASAIQGGKKINEMGAGDAFGEIALLKSGARRTASVVADSDLLCMELDNENFWSLLAARLPLGAEVERLALRRLKADEERRTKAH